MRPFTVVFSTMTVDGRIASDTGYSMLSCDEDFDFQHQLRSWADLVVVGSKTALKDNPRLTVRRIPGRSPLRGVVDSRLRVPPSARIFDGARGVLITSRDHPAEALEPYRAVGARIIQAGAQRVDLVEAWEKLYSELGVRRVMVEGGGGLNAALLAKGLVDRLIVTVSPYIFGAGVSVVEGAGARGGGEKALLRLERVETVCGGWVRLYYEVLYPKRARY